MRTIFLLTVSLLPAVALATPPTQKSPPPSSTKKAKSGEACKTSADCDQSGRGLSCVGGKCESNPNPSPPPPT